MRVPASGLKQDSPAMPVLYAKLSYWGISDGDGLAAGTSVVCSNLGNEPTYLGHAIKILSGDAAGQVRWILGGTIGGTAFVAAHTSLASSLATVTDASTFVNHLSPIHR